MVGQLLSVLFFPLSVGVGVVGLEEVLEVLVALAAGLLKALVARYRGVVEPQDKVIEVVTIRDSSMLGLVVVVRTALGLIKETTLVATVVLQ